jgi:hypothetical protein
MGAPNRSPADAATVMAHLTANPYATEEEIAQVTDMSLSTVRAMERRYEPVVGEYRALKRDLFTGLWQFAAMENLNAMYEHKAKGTLTAGDRRNYVVAAAVASEKALLFAGQPTQIVAGIHEHRLALPELIDKLRSLGERMGQLPENTGDSPL